MPTSEMSGNLLARGRIRTHKDLNLESRNNLAAMDRTRIQDHIRVITTNRRHPPHLIVGPQQPTAALIMPVVVTGIRTTTTRRLKVTINPTPPLHHLATK